MKTHHHQLTHRKKQTKIRKLYMYLIVQHDAEEEEDRSVHSQPCLISVCVCVYLCICVSMCADNKMNEWTADVDRRIWKAVQLAMERNFVKSGDPIVVLTGWKPGSGSTNTMRIITATDVSDKDLLPPITGITSVPSFNVAGDMTSESSIASVPTQENVKFF